MERLLADIVEAVRKTGTLDDRALNSIISTHNRRFREPSKHFAKKQLVAAYERIKHDNPALWGSWGIDADIERALLASVQMKPRRTASGVATVTVLTQPHPCAGDCLYCPSDVRMPKSYLHDEPACQRAERHGFDPYAQVASRISALHRMGHATDKVEIIVLGGSFTDYPQSYQIWFAHELFRALNDACTLPSTPDPFSPDNAWEPDAAFLARANELQAGIDQGTLSYNNAIDILYRNNHCQSAITLAQLSAEQQRNETAAHRMVGLVVETRPGTASYENLVLLRTLGCTKIQLGVQTLDEQVAAACNRPLDKDQLESSFELVRAFGFKSHAHFMANLPGANPRSDETDYRTFVNSPAIAPDEVKLYPCVLLASSRLGSLYKTGDWSPYDENTLVELLANDVLATPEHTRISRMIRDFSSCDIVAGNKKTNLRQMVEARVSQRVAKGAAPVREIRMREVATDSVDAENIRLEQHRYETSNTTEYFLQWVAPTEIGSSVASRIAGFLRLSLPHRNYIESHAHELPVTLGEAMIREVHVYGTAAQLGNSDSQDRSQLAHGVQHKGLGRALIERACEIAKEAGYLRMNVISAVGTRGYYRSLGFEDAGLYQQKSL